MRFLYLNFAIALWVTAITTFLLGIFVLTRDRRNIVNKTFALYSFCISWWGFSELWHIVCDKKSTALFWTRFEQVGVFFIPAFFIHFLISLLNIKDKKYLIRFAYILSTIIALFCPTSLMIADSIPKSTVPYVKYFGTPGILYHFALLYFGAISVYGLIILFRAYRITSGVEQNRIKYLLWSSVFGYIGGGANFLLVYGISIPFLNPFGTYALPIYIAAVAYAIIRHELMDIEVAIKKTLIFAGLFASVFAIVGVVTFILQDLLGRSVSIWISIGINIALLILIYDPLRNFLVNTTNKYLFQKKYDPLQLLKTFSDEVLASVLDKETIIKIAVDLLSKALNLETFAVMLQNKDGDMYEVVGSSGVDNKGVEFSNSSHLIVYLNKTCSHIIKKNNDKVDEELVSDMDKIKAELCMPLIFHKHLVGFLALGKRKSDKEYTNEDLNILVPLTRDIAIAIVYAGLYEDVRQKDKLATLGTLVAGIKHEIGNPLSSILTSTQLFVRDMEEWNSTSMSQKERDEKVKNMVNDVLHEAHRIARITKKFTDFARPGGEGVKEIVSIEESVNEALKILENEFSLKHIKIQKNIPSDAPPIFVDKDQIHQIFFNLLRNGAQAIEESNKPKEEARISIVVKRKAVDRVTIDISDTGCGIPEEKKIKIFEPFYTTKERGKGTGLGLAIVQQLAGKNRGDISFTSQEGEGTTFTLEFPIAKNE